MSHRKCCKVEEIPFFTCNLNCPITYGRLPSTYCDYTMAYMYAHMVPHGISVDPENPGVGPRGVAGTWLLVNDGDWSTWRGVANGDWNKISNYPDLNTGSAVIRFKEGTDLFKKHRLEYALLERDGNYTEYRCTSDPNYLNGVVEVRSNLPIVSCATPDLQYNISPRFYRDGTTIPAVNVRGSSMEEGTVSCCACAHNQVMNCEHIESSISTKLRLGWLFDGAFRGYSTGGGCQNCRPQCEDEDSCPNSFTFVFLGSQGSFEGGAQVSIFTYIPYYFKGSNWSTGCSGSPLNPSATVVDWTGGGHVPISGTIGVDQLGWDGLNYTPCRDPPGTPFGCICDNFKWSFSG